jgi:hypothetical protein
MPVNATNKFAQKSKPKARTFGPPEEHPQRNAMLPAGTHRVKILGAEELVHPVKFTHSYRFDIAPIGSTTTYAVLFMQTPPGVSDFKQLVEAAAGYSTVAEYAEFDPEGDFYESVIGEDNEYACYTIVGRVVDVDVTLGKEVIDKTTQQPTGDHYRRYNWSPVPDSDPDQDTVPRLELA